MAHSGTGIEQVGSQELLLLDRILAERSVRSVYQPLVDLDTGAVVAYEALARGPQGSALERPDLLFAAARRARRLTDLDVACRAAALNGAREAALAPPYRLFINAEPEALDGWRPDAPAGRATGQPGGDEDLVEGVPVTVVVELTERALAARPAQLLQTVARIRSYGWGVALDDVGADPSSLALLPMLRPDVIKLDLRLVQQHTTPDIAAIMNAVHAEAERSGTLVLAEGLETAEHVQTARAFGATLGQGWYFGRPGPLPQPLPAFTGTPVHIVPRGDQLSERTPFELAAAARAPRAAVKPLLVEISKQLEAQARSAGESALVLAAFQHARFFTPTTRRRYAELATSAAFVGALGEDMPAEPLPGVRGAVLAGGDPLRGEWDIAVLGPHFAATLVARDLGDRGPDDQRRFEFVLSHDRELTIAVAHALMSRVWPEPKTIDLPALPGPAPVLLPHPRVCAGAAGPSSSPASSPVSSPVPSPDSLPAPLPADLPEGLLQRAVSAVTTGLTISDVRDPDQPLVWVNEAFLQLSGRTREQVLGRNCRLLQGPGTDPVAIAELGAAIAAGRQVRTRLRNYRADGTPWWNELTLSPVHDAGGTLTHYIGVQNDVTAQVEAEENVLHLAYHDPLTRLANRARLDDALRTALRRRERTGTRTALLFIDLDDFKLVNDRHGHSVGDALLRQIAARLRTVVRADDLLARQGGDEFLLLLSDLPAEAAERIATRTAEQVQHALRHPFEVDGISVQAAASIGISIDPGTALHADELLRHADAAMYTAKRGGGRRHHLSAAAG